MSRVNIIKCDFKDCNKEISLDDKLYICFNRNVEFDVCEEHNILVRNMFGETGHPFLIRKPDTKE